VEYLVCRFKDDGRLFITTRRSRETMLSVLIDLGQEVESTVEKTFATYEEAEKYRKDIENTDKMIDKL
jgi:hypothetical protein